MDADITEAEIENSDVIFLIHVLHHLNSFDAQEKLISSCWDKLSNQGRLIVNEIDDRPKVKRLCAWIIDHILYPGDKIYYRSNGEFIKLFSKFGFSIKVIKTGRWTPFPQVIYILQKEILS